MMTRRTDSGEIDRVYASESGQIEVHRSAGQKVGEVRISGFVPCAICQLQITQRHVRSGDVLAFLSSVGLVVCISHFFVRDVFGRVVGQTSDYQQQIEKMSVLVASAEGLTDRPRG